VAICGHRQGVFDGIGDSAVKTGQDFAHVGASVWRGITKYLLSMATGEVRMPEAASLPPRNPGLPPVQWTGG